MGYKFDRRKIKKSTWLPALLLCYLAGMTIWFAPSLIATGEIVRLVSVFIADIVIIVLLRLFLVKRERQQ